MHIVDPKRFPAVATRSRKQRGQSTRLQQLTPRQLAGHRSSSFMVPSCDRSDLSCAEPPPQGSTSASGSGIRGRSTSASRLRHSPSQPPGNTQSWHRRVRKKVSLRFAGQPVLRPQVAFGWAHGTRHGPLGLARLQARGRRRDPFRRILWPSNQRGSEPCDINGWDCFGHC